MFVQSVVMSITTVGSTASRRSNACVETLQLPPVFELIIRFSHKRNALQTHSFTFCLIAMTSFRLAVAFLINNGVSEVNLKNAQF